MGIAVLGRISLNKPLPLPVFQGMDSTEFDDLEVLMAFKSRVPNVALGLTLLGLPAALLGSAFSVMMPFWAAGALLSIYCAARPMWDKTFPLRRSTLWALTFSCLVPLFSAFIHQILG